jgi:hypothetical protein
MSVYTTKLREGLHNNKGFVVPCDDGCTALWFQELIWDEGMETETREMAISVMSSKFYQDQSVMRRRFKERVKQAWAVLRGKDYYYAEILVNPNTWDDVKEAVNSIPGKKDLEESDLNKAFAAANNAIYFGDNSDYLPALYQVCRFLKPEFDEYQIGKKCLNDDMTVEE